LSQGEFLLFHAVRTITLYIAWSAITVEPIKKPFSKYLEFVQFKKMGLRHFSKLSKYLLKGLIYRCDSVMIVLYKKKERLSSLSKSIP